MSRIAPAGGYDFGNKRQYRRAVWRQFAEHSPVPRGDAICVLMPSLEGDEIEVALSKGFREQNLHVVDREPAIVATLKRRYRRINTHGIDIARMAERLPAGSVHCANLDLCGSASDRMADTLRAFACVLGQGAIVSVTMLRGREHGEGRLVTGLLKEEAWRPALERIGCQDMASAFESMDSDHLRKLFVVDNIARGLTSVGAPHCRDCDDGYFQVRPVRHAAYRSSAGTQTMLYVVARVRTREEARKERHGLEDEIAELRELNAEFERLEASAARDGAAIRRMRTIARRLQDIERNARLQVASILT
jgi:hypothetical protein